MKKVVENRSSTPNALDDVVFAVPRHGQRSPQSADDEFDLLADSPACLACERRANERVLALLALK